MDVRVIIWGILMHVNFLYNFWEFLQFFPELSDTRGPLGGPRGPGGPPQGGYPTWVPLSNNLNILRFWNILEWLVGHNKPKNGINRAWGGPRAMHPPKIPPQLNWGPPKAWLVPFFCLLCPTNHSKIFQKRRMFELLLRGTHVRYPPLGGPPRTPGAPPGVLGCQRVLEKIAKILKNYIKN